MGTFIWLTPDPPGLGHCRWRRHQSPPCWERAEPSTRWKGGKECRLATMLDSPVIWRMQGANLAMKERWRCYRADTGSDRLWRAPTNGL